MRKKTVPIIIKKVYFDISWSSLRSTAPKSNQSSSSEKLKLNPINTECITKINSKTLGKTTGWISSSIHCQMTWTEASFKQHCINCFIHFCSFPQMKKSTKKKTIQNWVSDALVNTNTMQKSPKTTIPNCFLIEWWIYMSSDWFRQRCDFLQTLIIGFFIIIMRFDHDNTGGPFGSSWRAQILQKEGWIF